MAARIGLYGGSFDPIHCGHLIVARAIGERLNLARVIFLPSARPPHKGESDLASPEHRSAMVELAIRDEPLFELSDVDLKREGPSYTIATIAEFRRKFGPSAALHWIIGADSLDDLTTWHRAGDLVDACTVVTAARCGWETVDWEKLQAALGETRVTKLRTGIVSTPVMDISSTDIRRRVGEGKSIRFMVPDCVRAYITEDGLYRTG
jgi:nicotinate-nucleotide adenylyltransferase